MATANPNDLSPWGLGLTAVGLLVVGGMAGETLLTTIGLLLLAT